MATYLGAYNPKEVTVLVAGIPLSGFAADTFINVERNEDVSIAYVGSKGEVGRVKNVDDTYTITITLQQISQSNNLLQAYITADEFIDMPPILPVSVIDLYGRELFQSSWAWIQKEPARSFSSGMETREWVIYAVDGIFVTNPNYGKQDKDVNGSIVTTAFTI